MKAITLFILFVASGAFVSSMAATHEEQSIEAILVEVQLASKYKGKARATAQHEMLMRHAVTFETLNRQRETYLIHSPVRLFGAEPVIGRKYILTRVFKSDTKTWTIQAQPAPQASQAK